MHVFRSLHRTFWRDQPVIPDWIEMPKLSRRMTLTSWTKPKINIILVGETGVGKTTILNLLANVCAGIPVKEFQMVHSHTNEQGGSQSGSQTNQPVLYNIKCADGHEIDVLDTPGLADTRGMDMDDAHKKAIAEAIRENFGVASIDAVLILANGTLARLGTATNYALNVISGMLPYSMVNNIGFVFTMVADPTDSNFDRNSLPREFANAPFWTINNPFAQWTKYRARLHAYPPTDDEILEDMLESVERSYKKTLKLLSNQLFPWLDGCVRQLASSIYSIYYLSTEMDAIISKVISQRDQIEEKQSQLRALQADMEIQEQIQRVNSRYEQVISRVYYEHEASGSTYNTLCTYNNCYSNCDLNCEIGFTLNKDTLGKRCRAFHISPTAGRWCRCRTCGHAANDHQHYRSRWTKRTRDERQIDWSAKSRFDNAKDEAQRISEQKDSVRREMQALERLTSDLVAKLAELCDRYDSLALGDCFASYISSAIQILMLRVETMKREGATPEAFERTAARIALLEKRKKVAEDADNAHPKPRKPLAKLTGEFQVEAKGGAFGP